jgi:hypothetical protein
VDNATREAIHRRYRNFAEFEAKGGSPLYEELALAVTTDDQLTEFVASLPVAKQQPNLVFAATRYLHGTPTDASHFAGLIRADGDRIRNVILMRSTQTNEPARCAVLLPVLARLDEPLALIEVGASAGLCLLFEHYGYQYGSVHLKPTVTSEAAAPIFPCTVCGPVPLPLSIPRIVWRRGLDLNPVDLDDSDQIRWLETLVWPQQTDRAIRLRAALTVAREVRPVVRPGDLLTDLRGLAAEAPRDATLVIFHSAVLPYLASRAEVDTFVATVRELNAVWISNESPSTLPELASRAKVRPPKSRFLLAVNGEPIAFAGPHGQSIEWLEV